jgi:hypothetical protein
LISELRPGRPTQCTHLSSTGLELSDPAQERSRCVVMRTQIDLEERRSRRTRNRIERLYLECELRLDVVRRRRAELRRLCQQPEQLLHDAQDQERFVALLSVMRASEHARHALTGAVAVVHGTAGEAAHDELVVDGTSVVAPQISAADTRSLAEREVVGDFE